MHESLFNPRPYWAHTVGAHAVGIKIVGVPQSRPIDKCSPTVEDMFSIEGELVRFLVEIRVEDFVVNQGKVVP